MNFTPEPGKYTFLKNQEANNQETDQNDNDNQCESRLDKRIVHLVTNHHF